MMARDAPDITPVSQLISAPKPQTVTGNKLTRKPKATKARKPPQPSGYFWRKDGAGWELRKSVFVTGNNGEKKRKQPYVAHMSREAFAELKRKHRGASLERAVAQWIREHDG
jgi:hypothetical protein